MEKDAFIMQLRQMLEIKEKIGEILVSVDCCVGNSLLESLFHGIGLDAKKHAEMLRGLLDRAQGLNQAIPLDDKDNATNKIKKVIELEWNVKNQLRSVVDKITDDTSKKILVTILGDVQRHEATLNSLIDLIGALSTDEEKIVDKIWKYSIKFDDDE
ncbi:MAG: hypothetical protein KAS95_04905 [Candidatus Heimdallarchaeota archaeon]|nr:hypothetical protein [Candidatus Heimdallarchaeota archaeon]